jgi:hypothetical protein
VADLTACHPSVRKEIVRMSNLRLHDAPAEGTTVEDTIPETFLFPGVTRKSKDAPRPRVRPSIPRDPTVQAVERGLDHAQDRLNNLRDLVDRFGLSLHDEGPRAA